MTQRTGEKLEHFSNLVRQFQIARATNSKAVTSNMTIDGIRQLRQSRRNFRAVTGISLEEQRQVAAEVYESGSHFLEVGIYQFEV